MATHPRTRGVEMQQVAIGIDLGGTQVRAALVDRRGEILARQAERTDSRGGPSRVLSQIRQLVDNMISDAGSIDVIGVGVSAPGPIDTVTGVAANIPTLSGFADFPLKAELSKLFPFPVCLENDGIAAAIGEWAFGAGRGIDNLMYVTVSTGIGGGVIADGRVLRGRRGMAAHFGHMGVMLGGELCACGNHGCFEAYASGTAFAKRARESSLNVASTILDGHRELDARDVFTAGRRGDALANALIDEEAKYLGIGVTSLIHLFSPEVVVIGGGMSHEFARLAPGIRAYISERALPGFKDTRIVPAELVGNSGLIGSAALVFSEQEKGSATDIQNLAAGRNFAC